MTHIGTRGGPRGDDELPELPPELRRLSGIELLRAAHALSRPKPQQPLRSRRKPTPVSQATPAAKTPGRALTNPAVGMPAYVDPSDYDEIPLGEPPAEEDWR